MSNPITKQIQALDALRELSETPAFQETIARPVEAMMEKAHADILNFEVTGAALETARARYVAAREICRILPEKIEALESSIRRQQAETP
jgi:hypothetical protein